MRKIQVGNIRLYEVNPTKDNNIMELLINYDYIIIYDKTIIDKNDNIWLLAPCDLKPREYYRLIKEVYPISYAVYNMLEVGFIDFKFS